MSNPAKESCNCTVAPSDLNAVTALNLEGHIGLKFTETTAERVRATVAVGPQLRQAGGIVHGGVYCSIIESVASWGGTLLLDGEGHAVGVNNNTDFLRSVRDGVLVADAAPVFRSRNQQLWRVVITDDRGHQCAIGHVRLQNVPNRKA